MATNEAKPIECPKCRATRDNVRLVYLFEARHRITFETSNELVVDAGFNTDPPGGATPLLLCDECGTRWPMPSALTVRVKAEEKMTTIFGPNGRQ